MKSSHNISSIFATAHLVSFAFFRALLALPGFRYFLFRRKAAALKLALASISIWGLPCALHASLGTLTAPNGDYEYQYHGPVYPLSVMHADMTANYSHPDFMFQFCINGLNFAFQLEVSELRKAPNGDWWADWVTLNSVESEFQNLGPDPFLWGLQKFHAAAGASAPGAWMSCSFVYPPADWRPATVTFGGNGIVISGGVYHTFAAEGATLNFSMTGSSPNNHYSGVSVSLMTGQEETDWLLGSNNWQTIYHTLGGTGSFSYALQPNIKHYYFLCRSMGDTRSVPAIIHVGTGIGMQSRNPSTYEGQIIYPIIDCGGLVDFIGDIDWDTVYDQMQFMISGQTEWISGTDAYSLQSWTPMQAGDYQIFYKIPGATGGPFTLRVLPASVTAQDITVQTGQLNLFAFASIIQKNIAQGLSYNTHIIIDGFGPDPDFGSIPAGVYNYRILLENYADPIQGNPHNAICDPPDAIYSPTYTLIITPPAPTVSVPILSLSAAILNTQVSADGNGILTVYVGEPITVTSIASASGYLSEHNIYGYTPGPSFFTIPNGAGLLAATADASTSTRTVTWTPTNSGTHTLYTEAFTGKSPGERINGISGWPGYDGGPFGGLADKRITVDVRNNPTGTVQVLDAAGNPATLANGTYAIACWSNFYIQVYGSDLDGDADQYHVEIILPDGTVATDANSACDVGGGYAGIKLFGPFTATVEGNWQVRGRVSDATARAWKSITPWNENGNGWYSSQYYTLNVVLSPGTPDCLGVLFLSSREATIVWNASEGNPPVAGYEIFRDGVSVGTTKSTSFDLIGLKPSTTYNITVRAIDVDGKHSHLSRPVVFKTFADPPVQRRYNQWGGASFPWQPNGGGMSYYELPLNPQHPNSEYYASIEYTSGGGNWINPSFGYLDSAGSYHNIISFSCWTFYGGAGSVYIGVSSVMVDNVPCVSININYINCYNDSKSIVLGTDPPYSDLNLTLTNKSETQGAHYYTFVLPLEAVQSLLLEGDYGSVWAYEQWIEKKPQNPSIFSGNQTIYTGDGFMPAFVGGSGTGAFLFFVEKQGASWRTMPWQPTVSGSYSFYIMKSGDDIYANATAGPYTLVVRNNPTGGVEVLDSTLSPMSLDNNMCSVTIGDAFYIRVNGSDLDGDLYRYHSRVTMPNGTIAHNESAERGTGDGHNGSRTFGPYTANVAGSWKVAGRVSDATARAWGSITPWNENGNGWYSSLSYTLRANLPPYDAAFVSQSLPSIMAAGASGTVTVTMRNTGAQAWDNNVSYPYGLGSQNPQDNTTWGLNRVSVGGTSVQPGRTKDFTFIITAPQSGGIYNFQWRMVRDGVEWFGASTPNATIRVLGDPADLGEDGIPLGMRASNTNGIPAFVLISLGLDPSADNSGDPRVQNIMRQYQYNAADELTQSPERGYQLDPEGNITGDGRQNANP